ncbi:hypothetical protein GCM10010346_16270 [Streptomyces chryseus]|uniref:Uncharacterized protein n=1 Tax=Streptomyces chryseus TaxID=68186 RepID=A0ABQ3DJA0_9ACTN|nr:hypothetical protein GCM10010346_16270 [Streptomyces chryseus]
MRRLPWTGDVLMSNAAKLLAEARDAYRNAAPQRDQANVAAATDTARQNGAQSAGADRGGR